MTGYGFDQAVLTEAGIERADAFAAVSSGDNSNIIAARVARETFGIQQVVARIYDPGRAEVYQRLGITTVATVKWTADQVLRRILPGQAPSPTSVTRPAPSASTRSACPTSGSATARSSSRSSPGSRIAWIDRLGEGMTPDTRERPPGGRHRCTS